MMMRIFLYNSMKKLKVVVCTFLLLTASLGMKAQVTVDAAIDSVQLLIGEQAKIKLQVSMDAGHRLSFPQLSDTIVTGIEIVDVAKPDTQLLNDNKRWLISQEYTVTSFDSALYYIPPFEVSVDNRKYQSKALALKVYSVPVDTLHPDQFFPPKTIHEIPLTWSDIAPLVYSVIFMLVLGALVVFFVIRYRDNKPIIKIIKVEPKLPPHQIAMQKIEAIKADKELQRQDPKRYYTELTDVLRIYMKERFGFNALEMTSTEIIDRLNAEEDKQSIEELKVLFGTADLVKFAKHAPMMNENDMNLVNAVAFINQTKQEEDPNAKKQPTEIKVEEKRSKRGRIILICCIVAAGIGTAVALYFVVRHVIDLFF